MYNYDHQNSNLNTLFKSVKNYPVYHGFEDLDVLKYIVEITPEGPICDYFQREYDTRITSMETYPIRDINKLIFEHLNGNEKPEVLRVVDEIIEGDIAIQVLEIKIGYYTRLNKYFKEKASTNININLSDTRTIINFVKNGESLFEDYLTQCEKLWMDNKKYMSIGSNLNLVSNSALYGIKESFERTYNGISPENILNYIRTNANRPSSYNYNNKIPTSRFFKNIMEKMEYHIGPELMKKYSS